MDAAIRYLYRPIRGQVVAACYSEISANGAERGMSYETEEVQPSVCVFRPLEAGEDDLVFVEFALLNLNVDPDDILPHYTPCTNIQMSIFSRKLAEPSGRMAEDKERGRTRLPNFP